MDSIPYHLLVQLQQQHQQSSGVVMNNGGGGGPVVNIAPAVPNAGVGLPTTTTTTTTTTHEAPPSLGNNVSSHQMPLAAQPPPQAGMGTSAALPTSQMDDATLAHMYTAGLFSAAQPPAQAQQSSTNKNAQFFPPSSSSFAFPPKLPQGMTSTNMQQQHLPPRMTTASATTDSQASAAVVSLASASQQSSSSSSTISTSHHRHTLSTEEKKRSFRNAREQQRASQINQQIDKLKIVLKESDIPFKPCKYSVLSNVVAYVQQLQQRSILLDEQHKCLSKTIQETSEWVVERKKKRPLPSSTTGGDGSDSSSSLSASSSDNDAGPPPPVATKRFKHADGTEVTKTTVPVSKSSDMIFVHGLDYKNVFQECQTGLCVVGLDGRLLAFNTAFEHLWEQGRRQPCIFQSPQQDNHEEMPPAPPSPGTVSNLFALVNEADAEHVFQCMGEILKQSALGNESAATTVSQKDDGTIGSDEGGGGAGRPNNPQLFAYWTCQLHMDNNIRARGHLKLSISLVKGDDGNPKFFSCALYLVPARAA